MVQNTLDRLNIHKQTHDYHTKDNEYIKLEKNNEHIANIDKLLFACRDDDLQLVIELNYLITDSQPLELTVIHESLLVFNYLLSNFPYYDEEIMWYAKRTENLYILNSLKHANKAP